MSKVYFVGCGPGDPELITIKAKKLVQKADVLVYSGSLIPPEILKFNKKERRLMQRNLYVKRFLNYYYKTPKKARQ